MPPAAWRSRCDPSRQKLAAGLLLTLPGTPFLYYGEEIGLPNGPGDADEQKRTPMRWTTGPRAGFSGGAPWQPFSTDDPAVSVEAQAGDPDPLLEHYRALIALRNAHPALGRGGFRLLEGGERSCWPSAGRRPASGSWCSPTSAAPASTWRSSRPA